MEEYGYLIHSAKGSTWSKKNHKYITKKMVNGKYVYFYNTPNQKPKEVDKLSSALMNIGDKAKNGISKTNIEAQRALQQVTKQRERDARIDGRKTTERKKEFAEKSREISEKYKKLARVSKTLAYQAEMKQYKNREASARIHGNVPVREKKPFIRNAFEQKLKDREDDAKINGRKKKEIYDSNKKRLEKECPNLIRDGLKIKDKNYTKDEDMRVINQDYTRACMSNPDWEWDNYRYQNNCASCSTAYFLRRKGFDVKSNPEMAKDPYKQGNATAMDMINFFPGMADDIKINPYDGHIINNDHFSLYSESAEAKKALALPSTKKMDYVNNQINDFEGDIGFVNLFWYGGGGHSIIWEKEDNGEIILRDCQSGKVMKGEQMKEYLIYANDIILMDPEGYPIDDSISNWTRDRRTNK